MDDGKVWVALITGSLALAGTVYSAIMNRISRNEQDRMKVETDRQLARLNAELVMERDERQAKREAEKVVSKFRDPLLHAAYDFQSRIYTILRAGFLDRYFTAGSPREKEYAVENTVFLVAQFLGWTEVLRQEIQFLDLGSVDETRRLRELQDGLYTQLHTEALGSGFRLFPGEQRAVGELMTERSTGSPRCLGFAAFLKARNPEIDLWLNPLREDVKTMATDVRPFEARLVSVQHALIDFLQYLDPQCVRFPAASRKKL